MPLLKSEKNLNYNTSSNLNNFCLVKKQTKDNENFILISKKLSQTSCSFNLLSSLNSLDKLCKENFDFQTYTINSTNLLNTSKKSKIYATKTPLSRSLSLI